MLQPEHRNQGAPYIESAKAALRGLWSAARRLPLPDPDGGRPGIRRPRIGRHGVPDLHHRRHPPAARLPPFRGVRALELVTVHEFGHNFFQGMIANNEFEEAWIDEGINSYYEMVVMEEAYGTDSSSSV